MRGRAGRGAGIGLAVGLALLVLLIGLPTVVSGDSYEVVDSLVGIGLPIVVVGAALGALIGASAARAPGGTSTDVAYCPSPRGRVLLAIATVTAMFLAILFFLLATGAIGSGNS